MTKSQVAGGTIVTLGLVVLALGERALEPPTPSAGTPERIVVTSTPVPPSTAGLHAAHLYGRITMDDGTVYEGRLRFGGDEEALWSHFFNGRKKGNPWTSQVPAEQLPQERMLFWSRPLDVSRPFMARMGELARIDAHGRNFEVTLKSGTVFDLARFEADDLADGLRVWDATRGVVDLGEWGIRRIEFMAAPGSGAPPAALYGTVRTGEGDFTGLVQWDREQSLTSDELAGESSNGRVRLRFDAVRSITRRPGEGSAVTLLDGREIVLSGTRDVGEGNAGVYVDDPRYGRVLVSWDAFESLELTEARTGPGYDDFPGGHPLVGQVVTRAGRTIVGRLIYDLDESETTETLDAPLRGVDYMIPFGHVASIAPRGLEGSEGRFVRVILQSGEELRLEHAGDLGDGNAGVLVFVEGGGSPEYVPWAEVERIDFERPAHSRAR